MCYCNSILTTVMLMHKTVAIWIGKEFTQQKSNLQKILEEAPGQVHISFDMWTSPNSLSLLGVIGHWIDANCILQTGILGL